MPGIVRSSLARWSLRASGPSSRSIGPIRRSISAANSSSSAIEARHTSGTPLRRSSSIDPGFRSLEGDPQSELGEQAEDPVARRGPGPHQVHAAAQALAEGSVLPTLVIGGAEDRVYPPTTTERLQASIPGSRLVIIAGAGHSPTIEQPETVTRAIADFLAAPSPHPSETGAP
jgi:pimeloyl-ACP methyl ester carboxylesterase